ncbi:signal transduction histidine kinase [Cohaesibacter marisflavi]|uniref:histidine kinase n=1 Tax=Cohaesibacter marisflavi TaxID=655353 RepID=A0A1I5HEI9_9HYPH|nr:ATP-binding protein [Cohaesibacter marisflavi]SFO46738.1 signal transduction histidine kinase [Cohaesibacter marisflavi]
MTKGHIKKETGSEKTAAEKAHEEALKPLWLRVLHQSILPLQLLYKGYRKGARLLARAMPKGLFARSLIIIVAPMVILQSVLAFVFMERHWQTVTDRLSTAVTQDIAAIIAILETYPQDDDYSQVIKIAQDRLSLNISILPDGPLPPPGPKPFFNLLDHALSRHITAQIGKPFWIDTVGRSNIVEIRIKLDNKVLRVFARRSQAYASNSHIFLVWMAGTSLVLLVVAILFLRNQIRPIQRLAGAAERFGKGQEALNFRPSGAREVRQAAHAFLEMKRRIERQIEQRTVMLAGVSHDLRTILTRFKLQLAILEESPETSEMQRDVDEMQMMLEDYLAFARGTSSEKAEVIDIPQLLTELQFDVQRSGHELAIEHTGGESIEVRPQTIKRCLHNLLSNATRYAETVELSSERLGNWWLINIDDDGPGIPEDELESVFRPFYRLDTARNQNTPNTGLGLAIARDIARAHGGDLRLSRSALGGLRATLRLPS